jgi:transposase-like protein
MSQANGSNGKQRRQFTAEEKATIVRRHLADKIPVSDLCDEYHIQPTLFYLWQRQAFEQLSAALQDGRTRRGQAQAVSADRVRLTALEARLVQKDAIIADVSEAYLALKKKLGES